MSSQQLTIKCPFCGNGDIEILHIPSSVRLKKGTYGGSKKGVIRSQEDTLVQTKKCPKCGKSAKEIKKALDTGVTKQVSHKERLKRIKELGLPTKIEG